MREKLYEIFKVYFRNDLLATRQKLGLTQAKMAEKLEISERSYTELESGHSCCNIATILVYLTFCSDNPSKFLSDLSYIFQRENLSGVQTATIR